MPHDSSSDPDQETRLSRRKVLGGLSAIGAAGALGGVATRSLLWDEEKFGNANTPNVLQGGELDLQVDWTVKYYDWIANTPRIISESDLTDQPGPIVRLDDVKPGDVIEKTLSAHIFGNPAFLSWHRQVHADEDNGITEPEDKVDSHTPNDFDGTAGGDIGDALRMVIWFDDGDGLPQEIWASEFPDSEDEYVMAVGDADRPSDVFDRRSPAFIAAGTFNEVCQGRDLLDPGIKGHVADNFPDSLCYQNSETESIGVLVWVPRDIPGVNDNIIQTDRLEYQFGFDAIQCRHNVANGGRPIAGTLDEADTIDEPDGEEPGTAKFAVPSKIVSVSSGDVGAIPIELENTETATLLVGSDDLDYVVSMDVNDGNEDGLVTVQIDTSIAGQTADESTAWSAEDAADSVSNVERTTPQLSQQLAAKPYPMSLRVADRETDVGTLVIETVS